MRVMVIVKATPESEAGIMPSEQLLTDMGKFNEELVKAGIMLAGEGLHPSSKGARVRFVGKERFVTDGPFAETKELIAGFWIWRVKSMEEAIEWVRRCPNPMESESDIEIRPIFEAEDFGEVFTPELREQEARLRAEMLGLAPPSFQDKPELSIAGLQRRYTMETRGEIPRQWSQFAPQIPTVPGRVSQRSYGVCICQGAEGFDYLSGVEVGGSDGLPADYQQVRIPARRYAVFQHQGHVSTIDTTLETIWTKWVPDAGLSIAKAPMVECYTEQFDPQTATGGIELWIPLDA